ncbi:MAG: hypothetical protein QXK12_00960 [Candidatus Nezhaarchaeales archaeon]
MGGGDTIKAILLLADLMEGGYIEFKGEGIGLTEKGRLVVKALEKLVKSKTAPRKKVRSVRSTSSL